jgi:hypothetical protein
MPTKKGKSMIYNTSAGEVFVTMEQHKCRNGAEEISYELVKDYTDSKGVLITYPEPRNEFRGYIETSRKELIRERYEIASEFGLTIA